MSSRALIPLPPTGKHLFPVLHMVQPEGTTGFAAVQAHSLAQATLAVSCGVSGLAVIGASFTTAECLAAATAVAAAFPELPIIINFMCPVLQALESVPAWAHLWTDKGVDATGVHPQVQAAAAHRRADWGGTWLCGLWHKGSRRDFTLPEAAFAAAVASVLPLTRTPVTSGAGTGTPPVLEELARLRSALPPDARLACASGITLENVHPLLPHLDLFLVATGIEEAPTDPAVIEFYQACQLPAAKYGYLDRGKTQALAAALAAASAQ